MQNAPGPHTWKAMLDRMNELGWSSAELGRKAGVPQPTAHRIIHGESKHPFMANVLKLCQALGLDAGTLEVRETSPGYGNFHSDDLKTLRNAPSPVPLISWVQAGEWCDTIDIYAPGYAEDMLDCPFPHGENAFCLQVVGLSMFPDYHDGEIILVDPAVEAAHGDDVVARTQEHKATFKRLQRTPEATYLLALNEDLPNRIIEMPEGTEICGVVTGSWRSRRRR
ncbi:MAG: helix-turn-helix domain-containing protein [Pseudomonas sp.]|nr:helix-turn-helix domain-containing protein [Pseudomonas sp.]